MEGFSNAEDGAQAMDNVDKTIKSGVVVVFSKVRTILPSTAAAEPAFPSPPPLIHCQKRCASAIEDCFPFHCRQAASGARTTVTEQGGWMVLTSTPGPGPRTQAWP